MRPLLLPVCAVVLLLCSCFGCEQSPRNANLQSYADSLSYAAGVSYSGELWRIVDIVDDSCMGDFLAGMRDSYIYPVTPRAKAYAQGLSLGVEIMSYYETAVSELSLGSEGLDAAIFFDGALATVLDDGNLMNRPAAHDLCNRDRYLPASEDFVVRNSKRKAVTTLASGLQYKVDVMGNGPVAALGDKVRCVYKGSLLNGDVFDTSAGEPVLISTYNVVPGLVEAFATLPAGTSCTVYVPWHLGYGSYGKGKVPPYAVLVYELEILEVVKR